MIPLLSNRTLALLLSLLSGMLLPLAFAPFEFRFIAFVVPGLLFAIWLNLPQRSIYLSGLLFQLGFFAIGVHWVYYSIHLFGNAVAPLALLVTALFVVGLAFICSLTGWIYARFTKNRSVVVSGLVFIAAWSLMEWIRDWLFGGFPWLSIGYSQIDTWFSGLAPIIGVYGIGFFVVFVSVLGVLTLISNHRKTQYFSFAAIVLSLALVATLDRVEWGEEKNQSLKIKMVQGNIKQQVKFDRDSLAKTLKLYADLSIEGISESKPDVVIWPETAIPTSFSKVETYLEPFVSGMEARGIDVLSGGFYRESKGEVYNAFRRLTGDKQTYLKSHLVPFGEFMPFRFVLDFLAQYIDIPMSDLSSGAKLQPPLRVKDEMFGISICYEDVFGNEMRRQLPESSVLVNVSNDTWFGDSAAPHQHQEIAAMRAREFSRPLVRVTNTGISSFISSRGQILDSIEQFEVGVLDRQVKPRRGFTPYMVFGNYPTILLFSVIFGYVFLTRHRENSADAVQDAA